MTFGSAPAIGQEQKDPTHTANFGVKLQEHLKEAGIPCEVQYPGAPAVKHASIDAYLIEKLKERGLEPKDVTDLLLTHAHYDHILNWTTFQHARIVIGAHELAWAAKEPWGRTPVPETNPPGAGGRVCAKAGLAH